MKLFRKSVEMWQVKLEALISSESQEMTKVFNQAFEYLKPQICLPLWLSWAQWSEEAGKQEEAEMIIQPLWRTCTWLGLIEVVITRRPEMYLKVYRKTVHFQLIFSGR